RSSPGGVGLGRHTGGKAPGPRAESPHQTILDALCGGSTRPYAAPVAPSLGFAALVRQRCCQPYRAGQRSGHLRYPWLGRRRWCLDKQVQHTRKNVDSTEVFLETDMLVWGVVEG